MPFSNCRAKGRVAATASPPALEPRRRKAFDCFLLRAQTKSSCTHIACCILLPCGWPHWPHPPQPPILSAWSRMGKQPVCRPTPAPSLPIGPQSPCCGGLQRMLASPLRRRCFLRGAK